jgi:hypothetical protein
MQLVFISLQFGAARHPNERPAKTPIKTLFMVALLAARLDQKRTDPDLHDHIPVTYSTMSVVVPPIMPD